MLAALAVGVSALVAYDAASPNQTGQLCDQPDLLCTAQVMKPLTARTKLIWPDGLMPVVRAWYRGPFERYELVENEASVVGGQWRYKAFTNVAAVRMSIENTTHEHKTFTAAELGLIVTVDEGTKLPPGALPAYVPGTSFNGKALVWFPPMPSATPTNEYLPKLLPAVPLPPRTRIAGYPLTALFDLSPVPGARIIGLGGGQLSQSAGVPNKMILTSLRDWHRWPHKSTKSNDFFGGAFASGSELVKGGCYVGLIDMGLGYSRVDCDQPHTVEVVETPQLPSYARDSDRKVGAAAFELCSSARTDADKLDESLNAVDYTVWPSEKQRKTGEFTVWCTVMSMNSVPLWVGPKTQAAIEASR